MKRFVSFVVCAVLLAMPATAWAHSGRTDAYGGHRDNKNASGLGSYHYHHGYGPHLHPGGVCPYAGTTTANNNSTGSGYSGGVTSTAPAATPAPSSLTDAENQLLTEARRLLASGESALKLADLQTCRAECLRAMGRIAVDYGRALQVSVDVKSDNAVLCRYTFTPGETTETLLFGYEAGTEAMQSLAGLFKTWFGADVVAIRLEQTSAYGVAMRVAARVDLSGLDTTALRFYSYDATANSYAEISGTNYKVDDAGYLHFTVQSGGVIIISGTAL